MKITIPALAATALLISGTASAGYVTSVTHTHGVYCPKPVKHVMSRGARIQAQMNAVRAQRIARSQLILEKAKQVRAQKIARNNRIARSHH